MSLIFSKGINCFDLTVTTKVQPTKTHDQHDSWWIVGGDFMIDHISVSTS